MLDTNTVSYILKGRSTAARVKLAGLQTHQVACISTITEAELEYGLAKNLNAFNFRTAVVAFLGKIQVLTWGREEASVYGQLRAKQEAAGNRLESMNLLIAAHAIAVGATLVTRDKVFSQVPDLPAVENWAIDL